jgi:hypothetical protein
MPITSEVKVMTGKRVLMVAISAATGTCFAVLAALSISDVVVPFRRFHVSSLVIAAITLLLAYLAFRAAISGRSGGVTVLASLLRGILGAFAGLIVMSLFLLMFGSDTLEFLAHAVGRPAVGFTTSRLLVVAALLGFGTAFVVRGSKPAPKAGA